MQCSRTATRRLKPPEKVSLPSGLKASFLDCKNHIPPGQIATNVETMSDKYAWQGTSQGGAQDRHLVAQGWTGHLTATLSWWTCVCDCSC
jgi:hypothetical protein